MRILFATDPWIYRDSAGNQMFTIRNIFCNAISALMEQNNDVKLLVGEDTNYCLKQEDAKIECDIVCVPLSELYLIYGNHYQAHMIQYNKQESTEQKIQSRKLIIQCLGKWMPEVIISFTTPCSVWNYVFPEALSLQFENGLFSRSPYPFTCQLDPFGFLKNTYPAKFCKQLRERKIEDNEKKLFLDFVSTYQKQIFDRVNPVKKEDFLDPKAKFSVLVPLSYNGVAINDAASSFRSQLDYLIYILEKLPNYCSVIVTRHSLQLNGSIPPETEEFLLAKYKNLSFVYNLEKYAFLSQWITPYVDAVITLNSSIAFHAAMLGKVVIALGDCEVNSVADSTELSELEDILKYKSKNQCLQKISVLYELLTRHSFPLSLFWDGEWLTNRLHTLYTNFCENGLITSYEMLPKIHDDDRTTFTLLLENTPGLKSDFVPRKK